ncbi:ejaculatory bulb-specific protein 3-like [Coccinella septempunctata]|uniref:ejaculatory bulb-specific protein 3-like n=1 Tax=Coccinella septempunctata TaxID=41139 RepID=UPI001D07408B|nr:ejaculatory bulb-specific protein 3-like [Coccinella septempunctata]
MKLVFLLIVLVVYVSVLISGEEYKSQYDDMDVDEILRSKRLLKNYVDCLLDKGGCPPPARELKDHLDDALKTECMKCTEKQKSVGTKVINFMIENQPDLFSTLQEKYDPEGIYMAKWKARKESKKTEEEVQS